jgi:hypothetical protein
VPENEAKSHFCYIYFFGDALRKFVSTFKSRLFAKETDSRWFLMICAKVPVGADQGAGGISRARKFKQHEVF